MVSILSQSSLPPAMCEKPSIKPIQLNELGNLHDAVEPFTKMISRNADSVRLHCTIPTWSPTSDTFVDLHDLHDLRTRFLLFIHDLIESLRSSGVPASYALAPSNSSLCLVRALSPDLRALKVKTMAIDVFQDTKFSKKDNALLADLEDGLTLIIT